MLRRLASLALVVSMIGACAQDATQVLVWVDVAAGSELEARATAMRVRVLDGDGALVDEDARSLEALRIPASISLRPRGDDPSRRFRVEVTLLEGDLALARQVADGGFVDHELREIWLFFDDACTGVACGPGRTCIEGACRRACFEGRAPGETTPSAPVACPCDCACAGDACMDGLCRPATKVTQVSLGYAHGCLVDDRQRLLCWGRHDRGQLGLGESDGAPHDRPTEVPLPARPAKIAAGAFHTCAILEDATVWCWGANEVGQLGAPGPDRATPSQVERTFGRLIAIGAGVGHTCVANDAGTITCWGDNVQGQLGMGEAGMPLGPTDAVSPPSAPDIELHLGEVHSCAVQPSIGRLFCWGSDQDWQLGYADRVDRHAPTPVLLEGARFTGAAAGGWHTCGLVNEGTLYCWGEVAEGRIGIEAPSDVQTPTQVFMDRPFRGVRVAGGRRHTCVIAEDSSMQCMGTRANGELGIGPDVPAGHLPFELQDDGWEDVSLGESFTCGVRRGGALYCWGLNAGGQLGVGGTDNAHEPARVCIP